MLIIIISLMALLFTHDICTRERETGTLKMMLSNPVSRTTILTGKMLGTFFTLLPMLLFSYGLCILVIMFYPDIHFTSSEWGRVALIFLLSVVFMLLFMAIGLFVSSRVKHSGTGIVVCLVLWVTFLFIIPNLANYSAKSFVKVGSEENLKFDLQEIDREFWMKTSEYEKKLPAVDWDMLWNYEGGVDGREHIGGATKSFFNNRILKKEFSEPLRIDYADKKWHFRKAYTNKIEKQQKMALYLSFLSPSEIFKGSVDKLCATNAASHYHFLEQIRSYRLDLIRYYKENKLFSSYLYFTQEDPKNFMTADEMVNYMTEGECKTLNAFKTRYQGDEQYLKKGPPTANIWDSKPLDLSDFPKFEYIPSDIPGTIKLSLLQIGVLISLVMILFYLSYKAFIRYDIR